MEAGNIKVKKKSKAVPKSKQHLYKQLKVVYCLLISSQIDKDFEELTRNDDIYVNMLVDKSFKVDIVDDSRLIKWYTDRGFEIYEHWLGEGKYLYLTWDNYRKICRC